MQDEFFKRKILFYSISYFTNFGYLFILLVLYFDGGFDKDLVTTFLIWGIPASISIIASIFLIRKYMDNNIPINKAAINLSLVHTISVIGYAFAIIYLTT